MMTHLRTSIATVTLLLVFAVAAHANLVLNGDFETGDFAAWGRTGNLGFSGIDVTAHAGSWAAFFGPVGSDGFIAQSIVTAPGEQYTLTGWEGVEGGGNNHFQVFWDGQSVVERIDEAPHEYELFSYDLIASGYLTELKFGFRNDPGFFHLDDIDLAMQISITDVNSTPEPSTLLLGGFAVWCLVAAKKVQRTNLTID